MLSDRVQNYDKGMENIKTLEQVLDIYPEYQLPEPQGLMSAKSYKNKVAEPLIQKLKSLVKTVLIRCFEVYDSYCRLNITNSNLQCENERLARNNEKLAGENENLRAENKDYKLLKKAFGSKQMDSLLEQVREVQQSKQRGKRFRNNQEETLWKTGFMIKNGLWHAKQGDYYLPELALPSEEETMVGIWGQRHLQYLKEHRQFVYLNLLTSGKLNEYLASVDEQTEDMFSRLVKEYADKQEVTEQLKAENQLEWVGRMNNIRACVKEVVERKIIYA